MPDPCDICSKPATCRLCDACLSDATIGDIVKWLKSQLQEGPARLSSLVKSNCYADAYAAQVTFLTIETIVESLESGDWRKELNQ